ncbi:AP-3 complex subunit beta-2-like isoform X2 [Paramacrobiotus metropolitanus]|nr:AP-3 complex subunit beta-2-like isoform X2 [Paramacrobiotus metropolitanus]XP_055335330.1 AP-3 complex subunit beta-2-like isoform X2 [Paramacrobiotus metropolitanus]
MSNGNDRNGGGDRNYNNTVATGAASVADSDYAADPASSTFFAADLKKHGDLKNMLESNKDQLRLEAMKRIIGMVAKGKDASDLFPAVVKNVVSKNIEIKKLVYAYLVRYAEEQQDLALLSISTFQRALKDPNQLIRANALRVLSSIRVPVIVPIMMLAIKDSTSDMSPYVRKTAALAIPKLYSLDDEQRDQLVEVIEKLLGDRTTLVIGSAVMAFEEVCPERIDLIHKNYRRLCQVLIDLEEWGQVTVLNMLTRYARMQFADPNEKEAEAAEGSDHENFYDDDDEEASKPKPNKMSMDADHRLLLRSAKPLLQSRNGAVVMAVVQLYHHAAPKTEIALTVKPLIRLLRSHREIQSVVLSNIATLAAKPNRRSIFVPHLKTFFVRSNDPTHIKLQKLEILTSLASEGTISIILREFQAYIASSDRELIASTIQAIGRCAITISEVTETCLNGLVNLLSNRDDHVVAESVCVIRKLLQLQPTAHQEIIHHLSKLVDKITVPMAKASILWLIGEYCDQVPKIGPDVLRQAVKSFSKEENIVKLQIINLAAKLFTVNPQQTSLLVVYVFNLARYDVNYDIRDRARFLRALILPNNMGGGDDGTAVNAFDGLARQILMATKPPPVMESKFTERAELQLGTLSHYLNLRAAGYQDLPTFPEVPPPSSVRDVEMPVDLAKKTPSKVKPKSPVKTTEKFYSDEESEEAEEDDEEESDDESDDEEESSDEEGTSDGEESEEDKSANRPEPKSAQKVQNHVATNAQLISTTEKSRVETSSDSEDDSDDEESEESSSEEEEEEKPTPKPKPSPKKQVSLATISPEARSDGKEKVQPKPTAIQPSVPSPPEKPKTSGMLLDFDDILTGPTSTIPFTTPLLPMGSSSPSAAKSPSGFAVLPAVLVPNRSSELLSPVVTGGFGITYKFPRRTFLYSAKMVTVELTFTNTSSAPVTDIKIVRKKLPARVEIQEFHEIASLEPNQILHASIGIDFCDTTQNIGLVIGYNGKEMDTTLRPSLGEMVCPIAMTKAQFDTAKGNLSGLNENFASVELSSGLQNKNAITNLVLDTANVGPLPSNDGSAETLLFVGQTISSASPLLISVVTKFPKCTITVNCEKVIVGSMMLKEIKDAVNRMQSR